MNWIPYAHEQLQQLLPCHWAALLSALTLAHLPNLGYSNDCTSTFTSPIIHTAQIFLSNFVLRFEDMAHAWLGSLR